MRKLGRNSAARKALFRSILTSFFKYGRIETTEAKAKELRSLADGLITLAKRVVRLSRLWRKRMSCASSSAKSQRSTRTRRAATPAS